MCQEKCPHLLHFKLWQSKISAENDQVNKKIKIYVNNELTKYFAYTDEYIKFDIDSSTVTVDNIMDEMNSYRYISAIIQSIFEICGYEGTVLDNYENLTYEKEGMVLREDTFVYNSDDINLSLAYPAFFQITLNIDKVISLAKNYGVKIGDDTSIIKPMIVTKQITDKSVVLFTSIYEVDKDSTYICDIYRSTLPDKSFEKIISHVNCNDPEGFIDDNLTSGTLYYYKARIVGNNGFGDTISVKTLDTNTQNNTNDSSNSVENPKTGINEHTTFLLILALAIINLRFINKKNTTFKKI